MLFVSQNVLLILTWFGNICFKMFIGNIFLKRFPYIYVDVIDKTNRKIWPIYMLGFCLLKSSFAPM